MMRNWIVAALAGALGLAAVPAFGQTAPGCPTVGIPCTAIDSFTPTGAASLSASTSSSRVALGTTGGNLAVLVSNGGSVSAYVALGSSSVVATTSSTLIPAGGSLALPAGTATYLAGITASSTATLTIQTGTGWPAVVVVRNPSSGSGGGAVTIADGADVAQGALADAACATDNGSCTVAAVLKRIAQRITTSIAGTAVTGSVALAPGTSGGLSQSGVIVPANTTSVALKASAGQLFGIDAFSISAATPIYIKLYNTAQGSVTCGSGTPLARYMVPGLGTGGAGFVMHEPNGVAYSTAITYCITAALADNDNTAPAASTYVVNFYYK